jgi:hypothetical protein
MTKQYQPHIRRETRDGREYTTTSINWVSLDPCHSRLANIL